MDWRAIGSSISQSLHLAARSIGRIFYQAVRSVRDAVSPAGCHESSEALFEAARDFGRIVRQNPSQWINPYFYPIATRDVMGRMSSEDRVRLMIQAGVLVAPFWVEATSLRGAALVLRLLSASDPLLISPAGTPGMCR